MAFKGEIGAEFLDNVKTGFTVGDIYRIIDAGKLGGVDIPFGAFVEWKGTGWEAKKDMQYAVSKTGESLDQAVADVLDDHASGQVTEEETMPTAQAENYTIGNYFEQDGEIWKCTDKTDNGDGTWTVEAEKVNGVVPALNVLNDTDKNKAESNKVVAIADATISSSSSQEDKWYKVATLKNNVTNVLTNIIGTWNITFNKSNYVCPVKLCVDIRINASNIQFYQCKAITAEKSIVGDFIIKVVTRGAPTNVSAEIWVSSSRLSGFYGIMVSEITTGTLLTGSNVKSQWNYTSYTNISQTYTEPVTDVDNNVIATAASYSVTQDGNDINNLMTDDNGDQMTETPPQKVYEVGKFYYVSGSVCRCTAYSAASATFDVYGVVEAMNYILSQT